MAVCIVGTYIYATPEWFMRGSYRAEPTTVWQIGVVLFVILHSCLPFNTSDEIINVIPDLRKGLSYGKSKALPVLMLN